MNIRLTFLLLAVLLLFGGTILIVNLTRPPEPREDQDWLWRVDDNSLVEIEVAYEGDTVLYRKRAGGAYWFIVEGDKETRVFQDKWSGTPLLLSGPRVNRTLVEEIENPAQYGLDPANPVSIIKITERTGVSYEAHMGHVTPDGENQYARLVGSPRLFTVPQIWAMVINRLVFQPPYPRLYDMDGEEGNRDKVIYFEVAAGDDDEIYGADSTGTEWYLIEPAEGEEPDTEIPVFQAAWNNEYDLLNNPRVNEVMLDKFENPEDYGLEPAHVNVWLATSRNQTHEIFIGDLTPDGEYRYAITAGVPELFTVPAHWAAGLERLAKNPPYPPESNQ